MEPPPTDDPALVAWIQPRWRDPAALRAVREDGLARPHMRYVLLDSFFDETRLQTLIDHHARLEFTDCDPGANYDSTIATSGNDFGAELFANPAWHDYLAYLAGVTLAEPGRSTLMLRRHGPEARGFWPHSDVNKGQRLFVVAWFNRDWSRADGALLQFWAPIGPVDPADPDLLRWQDHNGKRLDFLDQRKRLSIEAVLHEKLTPCELLLTDQILPERNRLLIAALSDDYAHSVTPSRGRVRDGFLQWLY